MNQTPFGHGPHPSNANRADSSGPNPFANAGWGPADHGPAPVTTTKGRNTLLAIVGITFFVCLAACGGFAGLVVLAVRQVDPVARQVPIADPPEGYDQEIESFNEALRAAAARVDGGKSPPADPVFSSVDAFVSRSIPMLRQGRLPPHDGGAFAAAVLQSPHAVEMNLFERMILMENAESSFPEPSFAAQHHLLTVEHDPTSDTCVANILFYEDDSYALACRWFLIRDGSGWKIYDHAYLEFGVRASDEWADYYAHQSDHRADNLYNATTLADQALEEYHRQGEVTPKVRAMMTRAENMPVTNFNRPELSLRLAWIYETMDLDDEAYRLLVSARNSRVALGVLPSLAAQYELREEYDQQLRAAEDALALSPDHPNSRYAMAQALSHTERFGEATEHSLAQLRLTPNDSALSASLAYSCTPDQRLELAKIALRSDDPAARIAELLEWVRYDLPALEDFRQRLKTLGGVPPVVLSLADAAHQWQIGQVDEAIQALKQLREVAQDAQVRLKIEETLETIFLEEQRYEEMLADADDPRALLSRLAMDLVADEFWGDPRLLSEAIERSPAVADDPVAAFLRGWMTDFGDAEQRAAHFGRFLDWTITRPQEYESFEQDGYLRNLARDEWIHALVQVGDFEPVREKFPNSGEAVLTLYEDLARRRQPDAAAAVGRFEGLDSTAISTSISLALQALDERIIGNWSEADRLLGAAIRASSDTPDEPTGIRGALARIRSQWLMAADPLPHAESAGPEPFIATSDLLSPLATDIGQYVRGDALPLYVQLADRPDRSAPADESPGNVVSPALLRGRVAFAQQQFSPAADHLLLALDDASPGSYQAAMIKGETVDALLAAQRYSEAIDLMNPAASDDEPAEEISDYGRVLIAEGNLTALGEYLDRFTDAVVEEWLWEDPVLVELRQRPDVAQELLKRYSPMFSGVYGSDSILMTRDAKANLDLERVRDIAEQALPGPVRVRGVPIVGRPAAEVFHITDGRGRTYVVVPQAGTVVAETVLPAVANRALASQKSALAVFLIEYDASATVNLWNLAHALMDGQTTLVHHSGLGRTWYGPDLVQRLRWKDRLPADRDSVAQTRCALRPPSVADSGIESLKWNPMTSHEIARRRAEQEGEFPAVFLTPILDYRTPVDVMVTEEVGDDDGSWVTVRVIEEFPLESFFAGGATIRVYADSLAVPDDDP